MFCMRCGRCAALMLLRVYFVFAVALVVWNIFVFAMAILRDTSGFDFALFAAWLMTVLPYPLFLVLGFAYFAKSKRVRTTYGENLL